MKIKILLLVFVFLTYSCSQWEQSVPLNSNNPVTSERVILIEDFTGASCPNCPVAAATLEVLLEKYPLNLVVMGIHSRFLANRVKPSDPYLWTEEAEEIEKYLGGYIGKPEAAINRNLFPNKTNIRINKPDTWEAFIIEELNKAHQANLFLNVNFDETSRNLKIKVKATAVQNINKAVHIHVAIIESDIVTDQKDPNGVIPQYKHKHVLRKLLTPTPGEKIADKMDANSSIEKTFEFTLPTDVVFWKEENCHVVAFISEDETSKYVLQAAEAKIK